MIRSNRYSTVALDIGILPQQVKCCHVVLRTFTDIKNTKSAYSCARTTTLLNQSNMNKEDKDDLYGYIVMVFIPLILITILYIRKYIFNK